MIVKLIVLVVFANNVFVINTYAQPTVNKPLIWNLENLRKAKKTGVSSKVVKKILKASDSYCEAPPVVVTNKKKSFAPDSHYYYSIGGYWWPSEDSTSYVYIDGVKNPERNKYNSGLLSELVNRCKYLSVAYYLTENEKYYEKFVAQVKAWFLDKETYMYPNLEYAAVVPGKNRNMGRRSGMIQAYSFNKVIESIRLINSVKRIDDSTMIQLEHWFMSFAKWADESSFGNPLHNKKSNNIGIAYDVMLINMYLFAGNVERAKELADNFQENRLYIQIDEEGKQPAELSRANAFSYSVYNLTHILDFCFIMHYWDIDYYTLHSERIDKAFVFLQRYVDNHSAFPYKQKGDWKNCEKNLNTQLRRKKRLCGETNDLMLSTGNYSINSLLQ